MPTGHGDGFENRDALLGLPVRPAQARRDDGAGARPSLNAVYTPILNDVEAPLQKGMSDADHGALQGQADHCSTTGAAGRVACATTRGRRCCCCSRITAHRAAHRLREHRQPPARARRAAARWRWRCGCRSAPTRAQMRRAAAHRVRAARADRRRGEPRSWRTWTLVADDVAAARRTVQRPALRASQLERRCVRRPSLAIATGFAVRPLPRAAQHAARSRDRAAQAGRASRPARGAPRASAPRSPRRRSRCRWRCSSRPDSFVKSLRNVSRVDLGIKVDHVTTFAVSPDAERLSPNARSASCSSSVERGAARAAGRHRRDGGAGAAARRQQLGQRRERGGLHARPRHGRQLAVQRGRARLLPRALGMPLLSGREFTDADAAGAAQGRDRERDVREEVQSRAATPSGSACRRAATTLDIEIVGLVKDAKYSDVKDEVPPVFFMPYRQDTTRR